MEGEARLLDHQLLDRAQLAELEDKVLVMLAFKHLDHLDELRVIDLLREIQVRLMQRVDQFRAPFKLDKMHLFHANSCPSFPVLRLIDLMVLSTLYCLYEASELILSGELRLIYRLEFAVIVVFYQR